MNTYTALTLRPEPEIGDAQDHDTSPRTTLEGSRELRHPPQEPAQDAAALREDSPSSATPSIRQPNIFEKMGEFFSGGSQRPVRPSGACESVEAAAGPADAAHGGAAGPQEPAIRPEGAGAGLGIEGTFRRVSFAEVPDWGPFDDYKDKTPQWAQQELEEGAAPSRPSGNGKAPAVDFESPPSGVYDKFKADAVNADMLTGVIRAALEPLNDKMEELREHNLKLQREIDIMAAKKSVGDIGKGSFDVNVEGLGEAIGKAVADAIRAEGSPGKSPTRGEDKLYPLYSWMKASNHPALEGNATAVSVNDGLRVRPNPAIKPDINMFYKRIGPDELLTAFVDGMGHMDYVNKRQGLIADMAALAYLQESEERRARRWRPGT